MRTSSLDHDCAKYGCAKVVLDPKLHAFDDCFGGRIRMGDADGIVERNGHILILEWKLMGDAPSFEKRHFAQIKMAQAFTSNSEKQTFCFVIGDPVKMDVSQFRVMRGGRWRWDWTYGDTGRLKAFLRHWYSLADNGLSLG